MQHELLNTVGALDIESLHELEEKFGFSYRQLLGETIFAMVIGRFDITEATSLLSTRATNPAACHFLALKQVWKWLRHHKHRGLTCWRLHARNDLPVGPDHVEDEIHHEFKYPKAPYQLALYTDAAFATCPITRRSPGGRCITLGGTAHIAKAKILPVLANSITEAELMEGVLGSKDIIYQRSVVAGLGFQQQGPTPVYIDNAATLLIANAERPTPRTRHMDIRWFAIQYWVALGLIVLEHIPGVHNIADVFTKILGWVLHTRHTRQLMGYNGSPYYRPE